MIMMKSSQRTIIFALVFFLSRNNISVFSQEVYTGPANVTCSVGTCSFIVGSVCDPLNVSGDLAITEVDILSYTNINGQFELSPSTCSANCTNCAVNCTGTPEECVVPQVVPPPILGGTVDENGCNPSGGFSWCPELNECIRPFETSCPIEGVELVGPIAMDCGTEGRCSVNEDCVIPVGSYSIGGPYLPELEGQINLPVGCNATCQGCRKITPDDEDDQEVVTGARDIDPTPASVLPSGASVLSSSKIILSGIFMLITKFWIE